MNQSWRLESSAIAPDVIRWRILDAGKRDVSFAQAIRGWSSDAQFRAFWIESLHTVTLKSYCWECPPVDESGLDRTFECVFVSSPSLAAMPPDVDAFAEYFRADREAVTFGNLGGDAVLVAPCPDPAGGNFSHLASFTATATPRCQQALWQAVGVAVEVRLSSRPLWLSTAGHGVAWLHVRLDSRPKYYSWAPYREG